MCARGGQRACDCARPRLRGARPSHQLVAITAMAAQRLPRRFRNHGGSGASPTAAAAPHAQLSSAAPADDPRLAQLELQLADHLAALERMMEEAQLDEQVRSGGG